MTRLEDMMGDAERTVRDIKNTREQNRKLIQQSRTLIDELHERNKGDVSEDD